MHKLQLSMIIVSATLIAVLAMLLWTAEPEPTRARIVTVHRGDVHQVAALVGRLAYADERIVYAKADGIVSRVYVDINDRVTAGEAMLRFEDLSQNAMVYAASAERAAELVNLESIRQLGTMDLLNGNVVRAETDCTVRQVYVQERAMVRAGTPVARVSSNQQQIVCPADPADVGQIRPDMWAWIYVNGESAGQARVESVGLPETDNLTGLTAAEVKLIPEQHLDLPENASIDAEVYLAGSDDVLSLPLEAITERQTVWWVDEGRCTEIPAGIVMSDEILAWVALPEGMMVAVGEFREGQRIAEAAE